LRARMGAGSSARVRLRAATRPHAQPCPCSAKHGPACGLGVFLHTVLRMLADCRNTCHPGRRRVCIRPSDQGYRDPPFSSPAPRVRRRLAAGNATLPEAFHAPVSLSATLRLRPVIRYEEVHPRDDRRVGANRVGARVDEPKGVRSQSPPVRVGGQPMLAATPPVAVEFE